MELTPSQAQSELGRGALLLDVREPYEWHAGHIAEAVNIPLGRLGAEHRTLPRDGRIVVVCRTGSRSGVAVDALRGIGYDAYNLAGGMMSWERQRFPVVRPDGGVGQVA